MFTGPILSRRHVMVAAASLWRKLGLKLATKQDPN